MLQKELLSCGSSFFNDLFIHWRQRLMFIVPIALCPVLCLGTPLAGWRKKIIIKSAKTSCLMTQVRQGEVDKLCTDPV